MQAFHRVACFLCVFCAAGAPPLAAEPALLWRASTSGTIISEISAQLQSVVAVVEGGSVAALGAKGTPFWEYKTRGRFLPFLTRSRTGAAFVCRSSGEIFALNRTGSVQWRLVLGEPATAPVLSGWDERVFIFTRSKIICLTAPGQRLWQFSLETPLANEPQIDSEGGIIMLREPSTILRLSPFGVPREIKLAEKPAFLLPIAANGSSGGRILSIYNDGRLELYNFKGEAQGNLTHLSRAPLAAAALRATAAVQLASGELVLLDVDRAQALWRVPSQPGIGTPGNRAQRIILQFDTPAKAVYVLSISGAAGFNLATGAELWNLRLQNAVVTPAFDEGILYSGGRDWIISAYETETRPHIRETRMSLPLAGSYGLGKLPSARELRSALELYDASFELYLEQLEQRVGAGNIGAGEVDAARALLGILGDERTHPPQKTHAARLLGRIGSFEMVSPLVRFLMVERDAAVQAEIALALGRIGSDPQGRALEAFTRIAGINRGGRNETLLVAVAAALGTMSRFSGPPVSERAAGILVVLAGPGNTAAVQHQARLELDHLAVKQ